MPMTAPAVLEVEDLHKSFGPVRALRGVDFVCRRGVVHALVGENGAGKSTLVGILSGVHLPDRGRLLVEGRPRRFASPREALQAGVAAVYQEFTVLPHLTVTDNVLLGQEPARWGVVDRRRARERVKAVLDELGAHDIDPRRPARTLSVSQRQLVEIARALTLEARVLIMDEPSAVLAGKELARLFQVIRRLAERGVSIVYVSHRLEEIGTVADEITILRDGTVVSTGPISSYRREDIIRQMVGRSLRTTASVPIEDHGETVLSARGLRLVPDDPHGIDLDLHRGEVVGVAGLMGSGRTRLARALIGLVETPGRVEVEGRTLRQTGVRAAARQGVAFIPEDRKTQGLALDLSVEANLSLPVVDRISRFGVISRVAQRGLVQGLVRRLDIRLASPRQPVRSLSGGNQQKVLLGKWLATTPRVLLLDEPFRGVDVGAKAEIFSVLEELSRAGMATLLISSDLPELIALSHRILVMRDGRLAGELSRAEASEEAIMALAVGRRDAA
ncbi:MAG TPA: sugar ABC transporter ATP-binding protein [Candidatus Dormibacteraeota bacterium]|nr:sugar ABC transporter ATP-binding protein [Candidatus Dormibacteraeota bacterium]